MDAEMEKRIREGVHFELTTHNLFTISKSLSLSKSIILNEIIKDTLDKEEQQSAITALRDVTEIANKIDAFLDTTKAIINAKEGKRKDT